MASPCNSRKNWHDNRKRVCVSEPERGRERECVILRERVCVYVSKRERECVCVCSYERKSESERDCECVCKRESERGEIERVCAVRTTKDQVSFKRVSVSKCKATNVRI
jgi:hypothetical protein